MRTIIAAVAVLSTSIASAAWIQVGSGTGPAKATVVAASALGATVTVEVPGIQTESVAINGAQYLKLTIPGTVSAGLDVGKPEVPAVPVLLARPTGSTVTLRIISIQTETLHVARVFPMQPPLKLGEQAGPLVVDGSFYASDVEYPSGRLSSPWLATWRDLDVVNVHVYPVAVRPARHEVVVTSRITFRVDFIGGRYPTTVASWMPPLYRRLIRNYDDLGLTPATQEPPGTKCLVFCDSGYVDNPALLALLDTMTMLGDRTEVINVPVDVDTIPVFIKRKIMDRYTNQNHALRWVFLVGESDQVPPRKGYSSVVLVPYSDVWYSDLDSRGYGYEDSCDGYPELGIARLSPESGINGDNDLSSQIARIRAYLSGTDADSWLTKTTLVAHKDTLADSAVRGAATMPLDFYPDGTRDTIMGRREEFDNTDITYSVEQGTGVLVYLGHGTTDRWNEWNQDDESWTKDEVLDLDNPHTPVVFNIACNCGALNEVTCLSEQWMRRPPPYDPYGAVASFGCSGTAYALAANAQCSVAVRALGDYWAVLGHDKYVAPVFDLGGIQMLMDAYVATLYTGQVDGSNIYSFMWLGNPAMQVWSGGIPESATVSYPSQIPTGPRSFHVSVKTSTGQPFENAQVCAYKDSDFYAVGLTNGNGDVWLSLTANDTGQFSVAASGGHVLLSSPGQPHTPMLPYFGTSEVIDETAFPTGEMTYPNWGRKLIRDPSTNTLHVVYTNKDSVFYTRSTDAGVNWSTAEPIGAGAYPASALVPAGGPVPWVAYVTSDGSIVRAIRNDQAAWDKDTVFQSSDSARAGAPSLAPGLSQLCIANAGVTYPVSAWPPKNYVYFNAFTAASVSPPETVDASGPTSCYGASIAWTPGYANQVAWIRGQSVFYRQRSYNGVWSDTLRISSPTYPYTEPASNPSVETYGEYVYCVWCGPDTLGNFPGDVWRRSRWLSESVSVWYASSNQSQSPDTVSNFPVMATDFATVWQEQVSPDSTEIWGRLLTDAGPHPIYQTPLPSRYPQVDGYWPLPRTWLFRLRTVWTEQTSSSPPEYKWSFGSHDYIPSLGQGLGPSPHGDYEPASYYAAELGQPKQSPYCLSRGGYAQFESWNADTSATGLTYQLPYLDPRRVYKLRAVLYHEGISTWSADLRCDSGPWHRVKVAPNVPDTFWLQVPKALYKNDARIVVDVARVTGDYVSLARLKLFQIEPEPDGREGVQSTSGALRTRLLNCTPSPFSRKAAVSYELAQAGPVALTVHDVSGRLVRCLESGYRTPGKYEIGWNATDDRGRRMPAGIYFLRFIADGQASSRRLTLIR